MCLPFKSSGLEIIFKCFERSLLCPSPRLKVNSKKKYIFLGLIVPFLPFDSFNALLLKSVNFLKIYISDPKLLKTKQMLIYYKSIYK